MTGGGVAVSVFVQDVKTYLILTLYLSSVLGPHLSAGSVCTLQLAAPSF